MTLKDFAEKYDIDYHTVYNASWRAKPKTQSLKFKEYDENDLKNAVRKDLTERMNRFQDGVDRTKEIMKKLS